MSWVAKWFDRPHRWVLVLFMFLTYSAGVQCLEADVPAQAIEVFKASITGMTMCLGIIGGLAKIKDVVAAAAGKPGKK